MKGLLRSAAVQATLGWILGVYIRLMLITIRWRHENAECFDPVLAADTGAIGLHWHGRVPICLAIAPPWWRKITKALVSPSGDGEFVARALAMNGCATIRISSAKKGDAAKARQAVAGLREASNWVAGGGGLIVTPDGPRGPNEVIAAGALQIAKRAGQPIFLLGIAANPAIQLDTWDKVMIAAPFGRGAVVWDGPHHVPEDADAEAIEALIVELSAKLSAATRRAEVLVGRGPRPTAASRAH
ncbi:lysophospholipid acyltransferase family protein [Phenylobacterium sp.]|uniref:lysophospholipid acyltransferase family protein n=1 Tax=Phenylobacterium sp. TaxID=1871053 RepID=UPI0011FE7B99|nr:lysophospholipid acyltransferase family protein [Phenylobacterium sp.]THD58885.1 MAG: DUF374 domain-containing protein [Phenylobacterium sp.]